jgi:pimeloyl-ACP methyl ester carboxylesterase
LDSIRAGSGPDVVLLIHSSGMSAAQWLRHVAILSRRHRVIAPHLLGYGKSPPWDASHIIADADDLAAMRALVDELDAPLHLVGHSYGGTLAARLALELPRRFSSLALFEPVLLGLLRTEEDAEAFRELSLRGLQDLTPGGPQWMEAFVDYWSGPGAFQRMATGIRGAFLAAGQKVAGEVTGITADDRQPDAYRTLALPALCVYGERTTLAGKAMTQRIAETLPNAMLRVLPGTGHMGVMVKAAEACGLLEELFQRAR